MRATDRIQVVYILGVSRSGSTVVGYAIGGHDDACFVGEMANTPARGWQGERLCSCGERWDECDYWTRVRASLDERLGGFDADEYRRLQRRFEPYQLDFRGWFRLARGSDPEFERYGRMIGAIFESLAEASGKSVIVDSSKDPGRALALTRVPGVDVVLVHVVRDARGVAYSMAKSFDRDVAKGVYKQHPAESVFRASALWSLTNGLCEVSRFGVPNRRFIRMRYEDFVAAPGGELQRVGDVVGLDYTSVTERIESGQTLPSAHILNGNRMRMDGGIRLKPDRAWETHLPSSSRLKVRLASEPMLRLYGY